MDIFTQHYLAAALWLASGDTDAETNAICNTSVEDLPAVTREAAQHDCLGFREAAGALLEGIPDEQAGHDFYLTRNRHGAGFWDREQIPEKHGAELTALAHAAGERSLHLGDDGLLYFDGAAND